jgi:hypothetical protein
METRSFIKSSMMKGKGGTWKKGKTGWENLKRKNKKERVNLGRQGKNERLKEKSRRG